MSRQLAGTCALLLLACAIAHPSHGRSCGIKDRGDAEASLKESEMVNILTRKYGDATRRVDGAGNVLSEGGTINVYFHVITNTIGDGSLSDQQITDQLDVLNDAFEPGGWNLVLAEKEVIVNDDWYELGIDSEAEFEMKTALRKGGAMDLNFYTASLLEDILGWATFPDYYNEDPLLDGVVCDFGTLPGGGKSPFNEGATATHEVGHWMGLYHTFQGGCPGKGDYVADTPAVADPNFGCPDEIDSCPNDGMGNDMTWNFMDYTDDACMNTFTTGQYNRMQRQWDSYRSGTSTDDKEKYGGLSEVVFWVLVSLGIVVVLVISGVGVWFAIEKKGCGANASSDTHAANTDGGTTVLAMTEKA